jgi:mycofactocin biosynthetic radical S-adenosylmethionine protein MftC
VTFDALTARSWTENRLFTVLIELTYRCNLDCFFCYNDLSLKGKALTFEQYATFLHDLADMNVLSVTLSGGEPLAHPDFFRIGALARELGFVVRVKSNGHALRGDLARRLRDEVDPFVIETSLHGAQAATHDRQTRVPGSFVRLIENLHEMLALGLRVKVNSTLTTWNENETAGMMELCDRLGVPLRFDMQVTPRDDGDRTPLDIAPTREGIRRLIELEKVRYAIAASAAEAPPAGASVPVAPPEKHCGAGSSGIAIDPYGNIYPCVQWRRSVANLHDVRIAEVWKNSFDGIRNETIAAAGVVAAHPHGRVLNFCPGLAEVLTGSATRVPKELERVAEIVSTTS